MFDLKVPNVREVRPTVAINVGEPFNNQYAADVQAIFTVRLTKSSHSRAHVQHTSTTDVATSTLRSDSETESNTRSDSESSSEELYEVSNGLQSFKLALLPYYSH